MRLLVLLCVVLAAPALAQNAPADSAAVPTLMLPEPEPPRDRSRPGPAPAPRPAPTPEPTAPSPPRVVDPFGGFGIAFGGDDVATLLFTDGRDQTLTAGQGGLVTLGAHLRPAARVPVSAFASVGFKFVLNASDNADIRLTRVPVEAGLAANVTPDLWAEASVVRHLAAGLKGDDFFGDVPFGSSTGVAVGVGWRWLGARVESIRYTDPDGAEVDASSVGLGVRLRASDL